MSTSTRVITVEPIVTKKLVEVSSKEKPQSFGDDPIFNSNSTPEVNYSIGQGAETNPVTTRIVRVVPVETSPVTTRTVRIIPVETVPVETKTVQVVTTKVNPGPSCEISSAPWPTIIISVIGAVIIIYAAVAPGVDQNRRLFGVIFTLLWTAIWALILWVLWRECHRSASWWILLIPVALIMLFFILVIILNVGGSV